MCEPRCQPMCQPLRGLLLSLPAALVIAIAATDDGGARRYAPYEPRQAVTGSIPHATAPAARPAADPGPGPLTIPNAALEPAGWDDLDGWAGDDHARAFATFYASCRPIVRANAFRAESAHVHAVRGRPVHPASPAPSSLPGDARPIRPALEQVCARAVTAGRLEPEAARRFFETNFVPVRIRKLGDSAGFVTGYYEPIVDGSRFPTREFTVPLYRRPRDLVAQGVAEGGPSPNAGRVFRRTPAGKLVPYYDRAEVEEGALDGRHLEICWLRTAAEALSMEMEGSGRVRLEDGSLLRISYDAHNGYSYVPAGRVLIERHVMPREDT